jgi:RNA polymerase sigma-70 factor (ECF subfamily)
LHAVEDGLTVTRDSERIYDEFLVAAAVAGDRPALSRLAARWQPRLVRHAWRVLGDAERARDMVQEAWVEILRGLARLDDVAAFPAWAFRIVTRRCQRDFGRPLHESLDADDDAAGWNAPAPEHESGEFKADVSTVMDAVARLPGPQRAALALFYLEDLSVAEIAIATDVPPGTVKTRLMHARNKVRAILEGDHS